MFCYFGSQILKISTDDICVMTIVSSGTLSKKEEENIVYFFLQEMVRWLFSPALHIYIIIHDYTIETFNMCKCITEYEDKSSDYIVSKLFNSQKFVSMYIKHSWVTVEKNVFDL